MRVITGTARGRRLKEPQGMDIRPTTDKVKESMFSILQFDIEGRRVLDLFGGTGQLGIEALSRGASEVVFVDKSAAALKLIRENLELCGLSDRARVRNRRLPGLSAQRREVRPGVPGPPYDTGLLEQALQDIAGFDICREHGIIMAESPADAVLPPLAAPYRLYREYRYGRIKLTVYHRQGNEE